VQAMGSIVLFFLGSIHGSGSCKSSSRGSGGSATGGRKGDLMVGARSVVACGCMRVRLFLRDASEELRVRDLECVLCASCQRRTVCMLAVYVNCFFS
jgi:hypothetical protein